MGYYNVVKPCVVGKLHYARPTTQPIKVDDEVAAPLVEDGSLEPNGPSGISGPTGTVLDRVLPQIVEAGRQMAEEFTEAVSTTQEVGRDGGQQVESKPRRTRRRTTED